MAILSCFCRESEFRFRIKLKFCMNLSFRMNLRFRMKKIRDPDFPHLCFRCEASNSANAQRPVSSSIRFNVFFEPLGLQIALERPDVAENKYDRAKAFKKEKKFNDDSYRIVMGGELVRLVCIAGG